MPKGSLKSFLLMKTRIYSVSVPSSLAQKPTTYVPFTSLRLLRLALTAALVQAASLAQASDILVNSG